MRQDEVFVASACSEWRVRTWEELCQVAVAKSFVENWTKKSPERGILGVF
jgi:adenosine deaminase